MIADSPPAIIIPASVAEGGKQSKLPGPPAGPQVSTPRPQSTSDHPGWRTRLKDKGIDLIFSYVSESAATITGGRDQGAAYTQQLLASTVVGGIL